MGATFPQIGVNGEGARRTWHYGTGPIRNLMRDLVASVDQDGTSGYPIHIDTITLVDQNDGLGPTSDITVGEETLDQREHVLNQLVLALNDIDTDDLPQSALDNIPESRQERITAARTGLTRFNKAIAQLSDSTIWDSESLLAYIRQHGITVAQLVALGSGELTGDALITRYLELQGQNVAQFQPSMDQAFDQLSNLGEGATIQDYVGNAAFQSYGHLTGEALDVLTLENRQLIEAAQARYRTLMPEALTQLRIAVAQNDQSAITGNPAYVALTGDHANALLAFLPAEQRPGAKQTVQDAQAAAGRSAATTVAEALSRRGITFTELNMDGIENITWDDVQNWNAQHRGSKISHDLFNIIANSMRCSGAGDDIEISQQDFNQLITIIGEYAEVMGLDSLEVAASMYLDPDTQFCDTDLTALQAARTLIANGLSGGPYTTLGALRTALQSVDLDPNTAGVQSLSTDVINAVLAHYTVTSQGESAGEGIASVEFTAGLSAEDVAAKIIHLSQQARAAGGGPVGRPLHGNIMNWLRGQEYDSELVPELQQRISNARLNSFGIVDQSIIESVARPYIESLINNGEFAKAERALQILTDPVALGYGDNLDLEGIEGNPQIHYAFAQAYVTAGRHADALAHARQITDPTSRDQVIVTLAQTCLGHNEYELAYSAARAIDNNEQQDRVLTSLYQACTNNIDTAGGQDRVSRLDMAFRILQTPGYNATNKVQLLEQLARLFASSTATRTDGTEVRATALEVIDALINIQGGTTNITINGPRGQQQITLQAYRDQIEEANRTPLQIVTIRNTVFPQGGNPRLDQAETALTQLQTIITAGDTASAVRAHAYMLKAQILSAQGASAWSTQASGAAGIRGQAGFQLWVQSAQAARQAALIFMGLPENGSPAAYYQRMAVQANTITAAIVWEHRGLWLSRSQGAPGSIQVRLSGSREAFADIARYLPAGSFVNIPALGQPISGQDSRPQECDYIYALVRERPTNEWARDAAHGYLADGVPSAQPAETPAARHIASTRSRREDSTPPAPATPAPAAPADPISPFNTAAGASDQSD